MLEFMYCKTCGKELRINDTLCNNCGTPRPIVYNVYKPKDTSTGCLVYSILGLIFFMIPILGTIFQLTAFVKCIKGFRKNRKIVKTIIAFIINIISIAMFVILVYRIISEDIISQIINELQRL